MLLINREARVKKRHGRQQAAVAVPVEVEVSRAFPALAEVDPEAVAVVAAAAVVVAAAVVALSK